VEIGGVEERDGDGTALRFLRPEFGGQCGEQRALAERAEKPAPGEARSVDLHGLESRVRLRRRQ
jgi:hypothetical protein